MKYLVVLIGFLSMVSCMAWHHNADYWYNKGYQKEEKKQYEKAIHYLDKAIKLNPRDKEAYNLRGCAKDESKNYKGALEDFEKAILLDSLYADAYYNKGNVEYDSGNYVNALWDYYKSLEIDPHDTDCKEMLEQTAEILFSDLGEE